MRLASPSSIVIRNAFKRAGFQLVKEGDLWHSIWGRPPKRTSYRLLSPYQKVNHLPGTYELGRKDYLAVNLTRMLRTFGPEHFGFFPKTYILPRDQTFLNRDSAAGPFIMKPVAGARGVGIKVLRSPEEVPPGKKAVVQQYLAAPYLIDGYKFDLRVYVALTSVDPLRVYMYRDGLVRFASKRYRGMATHSRYAHLTNYSVNKGRAGIGSLGDEGGGSKCRTHQHLRRYLRAQGIDDGVVWHRIADVVIKTLAAAAPALATTLRSVLAPATPLTPLWGPAADPAPSPLHAGGQGQGGATPPIAVCYELLGFDVLLDEQLRPWLLEVNTSPSLHSSSPLDKAIKEQLVVGPRHIRDVAEEGVAAPYPSPPPPAGSPAAGGSPYSPGTGPGPLGHLSEIERHVLRLSEEEYSRRGGFERIFPTPHNGALYGQFLEARPNDRLLASWLRYRWAKTCGPSPAARPSAPQAPAPKWVAPCWGCGQGHPQDPLALLSRHPPSFARPPQPAPARAIPPCPRYYGAAAQALVAARLGRWTARQVQALLERGAPPGALEELLLAIACAANPLRPADAAAPLAPPLEAPGAPAPPPVQPGAHPQYHYDPDLPYNFCDYRRPLYPCVSLRDDPTALPTPLPTPPWLPPGAAAARGPAVSCCPLAAPGCRTSQSPARASSASRPGSASRPASASRHLGPVLFGQVGPEWRCAPGSPQNQHPNVSCTVLPNYAAPFLLPRLSAPAPAPVPALEADEDCGDAPAAQGPPQPPAAAGRLEGALTAALEQLRGALLADRQTLPDRTAALVRRAAQAPCPSPAAGGVGEDEESSEESSPEPASSVPAGSPPACSPSPPAAPGGCGHGPVWAAPAGMVDLTTAIAPRTAALLTLPLGASVGPFAAPTATATATATATVASPMSMTGDERADPARPHRRPVRLTGRTGERIVRAGCPAVPLGGRLGPAGYAPAEEDLDLDSDDLATGGPDPRTASLVRGLAPTGGPSVPLLHQGRPGVPMTAAAAPRASAPGGPCWDEIDRREVAEGVYDDPMPSPPEIPPSPVHRVATPPHTTPRRGAHGPSPLRRSQPQQPEADGGRFHTAVSAPPSPVGLVAHHHPSAGPALGRSAAPAGPNLLAGGPPRLPRSLVAGEGPLLRASLHTSPARPRGPPAAGGARRHSSVPAPLVRAGATPPRGPGLARGAAAGLIMVGSPGPVRPFPQAALTPHRGRPSTTAQRAGPRQ
ncbi:putative tubulin polyglutamylase TTLL4 [Paratrimastix pyriformis]|uniref:Tubulin--tyrosine ligase-like protein 5 n=1 Tax=Paratrimastix pyriformis TaxID=342808 RepID=A0ABQ8UHA9_9EUKA|nr:putative tubulin polyglutamylase TTLL4 [Paratrimastix pyriformis]